MGVGRQSTSGRNLNPREQALAREVFKNKLPAFRAIGVLNGLGVGDRPWTDNTPIYISRQWFSFQMMIGDLANTELTSSSSATPWLGADYGTVSDVFIHEMTHVWQYYRGVWVKARSGAAQAGEAVLKHLWHIDSDAYGYTPGAPWDDYNPEQQAHLVEDWHHRGRRSDDQLYPYIHFVVQHDPGRYGSWSLSDLTILLQGDFSGDDHVGPRQVTQRLTMPKEFSDKDLIEILDPRFAANDEAGAVGRVRELAFRFSGMGRVRAQSVLNRLQSRSRTDRLVALFWNRLSGPSQERLLGILRKQAGS